MTATARRRVLRCLELAGDATTGDLEHRLDLDRLHLEDTLEELHAEGMLRRTTVAGVAWWSLGRTETPGRCSGACSALGLEDLRRLAEVGCSRCGQAPAVLEAVAP